MIKHRDKNIDIAKGLGIFLVVWGHTSATPEWISAFHMPLFFFLSGIFFRPNPNWCQFLKSKSRRLLIPYIIYFYICNIFDGILHMLRDQPFNWSDRLLQFWAPHAMAGPLWFLLALFWMLCLSNLLWQLAKSQWIIGVGCILLCLIGWYETHTNHYHGLFLTHALIEIPFFFLGHLLHNININRTKASLYVTLKDTLPHYMLLLIGGFNILIFSILYKHSDLNALLFPKVYIYYTGAIAGINTTLIISILIYRYLKGALTSLFENWGCQSLGIMGIHNCLLSLMLIGYCQTALLIDKCGLWLFTIGPIDSQGCFIIGLLLAIPTTFISYLIVKRIPI